MYAYVCVCARAFVFGSIKILFFSLSHCIMILLSVFQTRCVASLWICLLVVFFFLSVCWSNLVVCSKFWLIWWKCSNVLMALSQCIFARLIFGFYSLFYYIFISRFVWFVFQCHVVKIILCFLLNNSTPRTPLKCAFYWRSSDFVNKINRTIGVYSYLQEYLLSLWYVCICVCIFIILTYKLLLYDSIFLFCHHLKTD